MIRFNETLHANKCAFECKTYNIRYISTNRLAFGNSDFIRFTSNVLIWFVIEFLRAATVATSFFFSFHFISFKCLLIFNFCFVRFDWLFFILLLVFSFYKIQQNIFRLRSDENQNSMQWWYFDMAKKKENTEKKK